ncbi:MAG: hypothetical protein N4A57_02585 [Anaeromicrobium sp.]|jgi:hypothetical protein|uniref:hypothetical protein n=1 Tax=Anaeromicrobium sp. TaxID=1929132 RepID=UPI0025DD8563|nr:hypothetical protein [Anaeromicrobium sp.]MCT4593147.1 hypothetical protein [Anaeromicrobium sp.]
MCIFYKPTEYGKSTWGDVVPPSPPWCKLKSVELISFDRQDPCGECKYRTNDELKIEPYKREFNKEYMELAITYEDNEPIPF